MNHQVADKLDAITESLWGERLEVQSLPPAAALLVWQPLREEGLGFTAARHLQGAAVLASWKQVGPAVLTSLQIQGMETLWGTAPRIEALLREAASLVAPSVLEDMATM